MDDLRQQLFEQGRVGKVIEALRKQGSLDPSTDPQRALLHGHALYLYGDYQQALKVYSSIPLEPLHDSERLWGLANVHLRLGDLKQVTALLEDALQRTPPSWLSPRIYNAFVNLFIQEGRFEQALAAVGKGIEQALVGGHLTEQLILEGNRGVVEIHQGAFEEAAFQLQRAVNQLLVRNCILSAANFLINLSSAFQALGGRSEVAKCLNRAEKLIQESGSKGRLIFLRQVQGEFWEMEGLLDKAGLAYENALELMRELPNPRLETRLNCDLAHLFFERGDIGGALSLIRKTLTQIRERGFRSEEDLCLGYEGKFRLLSGAAEEGLALLDQARELAESQGKWNFYSYIALYLSLGHEKLKQKGQALDWLRKSLEVAERCRMSSSLLVEREVLTSLLLDLGRELPLTEFLSKLTVQLHHPALLKRFLRQSPEGKILFLRSLKVHDARRFQPELARLKNDPHKEVRRTARRSLNGWHQHAAYRVYTFATLRVFLEGKMLADKDWIRPGVKRLFLYLATHPDEWHATDKLLETLWHKPHPEKTRNVLKYLYMSLRKVLEPWARLAGDYVFFQSQQGAYGFFPGERFWIDAWEFEEKAKHAEKAHLQRNFKETRKAYREALDLYLGDYLEEISYEDWLNPRRDYLRELYFRGVLKYATLEKASGNLPEARRVLEEALFKDLSRSGCAALLIQVLIQMKLTHEAKDWGRRHIDYIKKELKEKPAPEVMEALGKFE